MRSSADWPLCQGNDFHWYSLIAVVTHDETHVCCQANQPYFLLSSHATDSRSSIRRRAARCRDSHCYFLFNFLLLFSPLLRRCVCHSSSSSRSLSLIDLFLSPESVYFRYRPSRSSWPSDERTRIFSLSYVYVRISLWNTIVPFDNGRTKGGEKKTIAE